jgi:hypothetical protein
LLCDINATFLLLHPINNMEKIRIKTRTFFNEINQRELSEAQFLDQTFYLATTLQTISYNLFN